MNDQDLALIDRLITICWEKGGMTSPQFANACAALLRKVQGIVQPQQPALQESKKG